MWVVYFHARVSLLLLSGSKNLFSTTARNRDHMKEGRKRSSVHLYRTRPREAGCDRDILPHQQKLPEIIAGALSHAQRLGLELIFRLIPTIKSQFRLCGVLFYSKRCTCLCVQHANTNTPTSHTLLLLLLALPPLPLPNPMLKQLCPMCESSTGSVRVIDDAVSTGNMF